MARKEYKPSGRNHLERRSHRELTQDEFDWLIEQLITGLKTTREAIMQPYSKGNFSRRPGYIARQCVVHLAWVSYDTSYDTIAGYFSITTQVVRLAVKTVDDWRADDPELDSYLTLIENAIIERRINHV